MTLTASTPQQVGRAAAQGPEGGGARLRWAGLAAIVGQVLLLVSSAAHPAREHPADHLAVFHEYATTATWTTVHLVQWLGGMLFFVALAMLARHVIERAGAGAGAARCALAVTFTVAGIFTVLQAVDGVALKMAVDRWLTADEAQRAAAFSAAEAIRWIEIGLNAIARLLQGVAVGLTAVVATKARIHGRALGVLGVVAGVGGIAGSVATAYTGFSTLVAAIGMGPWLAQTMWIVALGVCMMRRNSDPARVTKVMPRLGVMVLLITALAMTSCATTKQVARPTVPSSPVTAEQARAMAEAMLAAYNTGDYLAYSREWSPTMKKAIGPKAFASFRQNAMSMVGRFVEITGAELKPGQKDPRVARHEFTARFAKDDRVMFVIAFDPGDALIDGAHFDPSV